MRFVPSTSGSRTSAISFVLVVLCSCSTSIRVVAQNIVQSNDDGWAIANIRAFNSALRAAGFKVLLSAPAENQSGSSSKDAPPKPVGPQGCEYDSCPPNSPAVGFNASDTSLNYVNSYPATAMKYGIQVLSPVFFAGMPDLAVSGPNTGSNLGRVVLESGTVGAATEAAKEGIPSIAISGASGSQVSYITLSSPSSSTTAANIYASLSTTLTRTLLSTSRPFLPPSISLNVNFPLIKPGSCDTTPAFKFVLTRINDPGPGVETPNDVVTCGTSRLPTEETVVNGGGCFASISVMNATTKGDVDASTQSIVLGKFGSILTCK